MNLVNHDGVHFCPKCGSDHLNHAVVTVCGRKDDAAMVLRTVTENGVSRTELPPNAPTGAPGRIKFAGNDKPFPYAIPLCRLAGESGEGFTRQ